MWTATAITAGAPLLFTAVSAPFWLAGGRLVRDTVSPVVVETQLSVVLRGGWRLTARARGVTLRTLEGAAEDLDGVRRVVAEEKEEGGADDSGLVLVEGVRSHRFGEGLQAGEAAWVADEVNAFLGVQPERDLLR